MDDQDDEPPSLVDIGDGTEQTSNPVDVTSQLQDFSLARVPITIVTGVQYESQVPSLVSCV